jgi:hypothetical protein
MESNPVKSFVISIFEKFHIFPKISLVWKTKGYSKKLLGEVKSIFASLKHELKILVFCTWSDFYIGFYKNNVQIFKNSVASGCKNLVFPSSI